MDAIENKIEDVKRLDEIIKIISKEGTWFIIEELDLEKRISPIRRLTSDKKKIPPPERLRETLEKLGPTFIKFGQIMAQRPDIIPERYIKELEKLEDDVPQFSGKKAKKIVNQEIGLEKFQNFEKEPIAAASIAQVHKGKLKTGQEVVVKIRRPEIKEKIKRDLEILEYLAERAEKRSKKMKKHKVREIVKEFSKWTKNELDMEKERKNMEIFRKNMSEEKKVKIPQSYKELTTEKVLTMEYMEGFTVKNEEKIKEMDINKEKIARNIIRIGLKQVIRDGFFHADPHPSNFLLNEKGEIIMLDFGMIGKFTKNMREKIGLLFIYAWKEEIDKLIDVLKDIGRVSEDADIEGLKEEIKGIILLLRNSSIEETNISRQLLKIASISSERGVQLPSSLVIMGKSLATIEGIGLKIYPEFQPGEEFQETVKEILKESISAKEIKEELEMNLIANKKELTEIPSKINEITKQNQQKIQIKEERNQNETITAALIIGGILVLISKMPNKTAFPITGILFLIAYKIYQ